MAAQQDKKQHNKAGRGFGRPFEKGKSGNPSGRPKGSVSPTTILRQLLTTEDAKTVVQNLLEIAKTRPKRRKIYGCNCLLHNKDGGRYETYDAAEIRLYEFAVSMLFERSDGKATQPIAGDTDHPLVFTIDLASGSNADNSVPAPPAVS